MNTTTTCLVFLYKNKSEYGQRIIYLIIYFYMQHLSLYTSVISLFLLIYILYKLFYYYYTVIIIFKHTSKRYNK